MGKGKRWSNIETKAVVEAFIHISEDALIGTNQSGETLYRRVTEEAKSRYSGDWMRSTEATKKRWLEVAKDVQRFCASMKFVTSTEHSGWNEDDYFKAANEYFLTSYGCKFKYVDEWQLLKGYEKWKTTENSSSLTKLSETSCTSSLSSGGSTGDSKPSRPAGTKKQRTLVKLESKADEWFNKMQDAICSTESQNQSERILEVMEKSIDQSRKNCEFLQDVLQTQTEKFTLQLQKSTALKALSKLDMSSMSDNFQERAKRKLEEELSSILDF